MSNVFIDTFELTYKTDFDTMKKMTENFKKYKTHKNNVEYVCVEFAAMGFIIKSKKCSDKERRDRNKNYRISIIVDPNRVYIPHTNIKHICNTEDFDKMIDKMDMLFSFWFEDTGITLNDFTLTRIDITKDIHDIPEKIIREYIMIMRRMTLYSGYELNRQLEENTENFRPEDSFNAINVSRQVEFVVYNKHRAAIDQNYSDEDKEYYEDTMRVEARCTKGFIKKKTKHMSVSRALRHIFGRRYEYLNDIYNSVFLYYTDTCFVQNYWQNKIIKDKFQTKQKRVEKMHWLIIRMSSKQNYTLAEALENYKGSDDAKQNLLNYFDKAGISPIPIQRYDIPFMQSIDSILEFDEPNEADRKYSNYLKQKTRSKEVFFHEPVR